MLAVGAAFGPTAVAAAQDAGQIEPPAILESAGTSPDGPNADDGLTEVPPADAGALAAAWTQYATEVFEVDLDEDGVVDLADLDGDGVPEVLTGEPGERDLPPADITMLQVGSELETLGFDTLVAADTGSRLVGDCSGMALSFDEDGILIDWALGVGSNAGGGPDGQLVDLHGDGQVGTRAFTEVNPFQVGETVIYFGNLPLVGEGPLEHDWRIATAGISVDSGGDANLEGKNRNVGQVALGDQLPDLLRPAGIFPMSGELTSENGLGCEADGWIEFVLPNPLFTAPAAVAALVGIGGAAGLFFNSRPARTWKA